MTEEKQEDDKITMELSLSADSVEEMRGILIYLAKNLEDIDKHISGAEPSLIFRERDRRH